MDSHRHARNVSAYAPSMTERIIKSNGVDICTEAFGDPSATPILLIMGASASMLMWPEEFCEQLAAGGRYVIRYDNRDTGRSIHYPVGEPGYTVEDMADDAAAVLDAYGIDTAHIVGASMGGMITQQVALRHRNRARTITPIMSTPDPGAIMAAMAGGDDSTALSPPSAEVMAVAFISRAARLLQQASGHRQPGEDVPHPPRSGPPVRRSRHG